MIEAWAFLKSIPAWAWVAVAAVLVVIGAYYKGASDKNEQWEARLAKAEAEAKQAAEEARLEADSEAEKRALVFAAQQAALRGAIDDASKTGTNPLDAIFGGMSEAD